MSEISEIRREYRQSTLNLDRIDANPFNQFRFWLNDALRSRVNEPTAMTLATATPDGRPSARIVLLKDFDNNGFTFYKL